MNPSPSTSLWLLFPAVTMSLGWGLRGYIGGGPLGAMIPGALVALALCLLLRRDDAALIAAFGAAGIGFGGEMTYGQTIGLALAPETSWFGLAGLALKGAIWGLLGGGVLGLALKLPGRRRLLIGFLLMLLGTWIGWKLINEPKLIYFSNRLDRPRPEIWAGLLLGALLMLAWCRSRIAWMFALYACIGGGIGFGVGGWFQVVGRTNWPHSWVEWWKLMEFTFGFCFGWALGYAAWRHREVLSTSPSQLNPRSPGTALTLLVAGLAIPGALWLSEHFGIRFGYMVVGAGLMALTLWRPHLGWHVAITMTFCAFVIDYFEHIKSSGWPVVVLTTLGVFAVVERRPRALPLFLLLLWTANIDSYFKTMTAPKLTPGHLIVEGVFTLFGIAATIAAFRVQRESLDGRAVIAP